jgi:hypothetical protein
MLGYLATSARFMKDTDAGGRPYAKTSFFKKDIVRYIFETEAVAKTELVFCFSSKQTLRGRVGLTGKAWPSEHLRSVLFPLTTSTTIIIPLDHIALARSLLTAQAIRRSSIPAPQYP